MPKPPAKRRKVTAVPAHPEAPEGEDKEQTRAFLVDTGRRSVSPGDLQTRLPAVDIGLLKGCLCCLNAVQVCPL
jgi:hypothetical protein